MRYLIGILTVFILAATPALAMDGVSSDTGDAYTVDDGTVFTEGATVTIYDADGVEHEMQVLAAADDTDSVTVDLVDNDSGDAKTIEFMK